MGTLYIIGNGFDLHFGLKTNPADFVENLRNQSLYNATDNAFDILNFYGVDWHEYEQSLNNIDLDEIVFQNEIPPDYLSDRESDRDSGIYNMQMHVDSISDAINTALEEMVAYADDDAWKLSTICGRKNLFQSGDSILTFNYTSTIEYLFFVPDNVNIFHIHGCYADKKSRLIFGYKNAKNRYEESWSSLDEGNWDYYIAQQRQIVYDFYDNWKKQFQLDNLRSFLLNCPYNDNVIVLGHSMNAVDSEYMELIETILHPKIWKISYYKPGDIDTIRSQRYSFDYKIEFTKIEEIVGYLPIKNGIIHG